MNKTALLLCALLGLALTANQSHAQTAAASALPPPVTGQPTVTLTAPVPQVAVGSGQTGEFLLTLPAAQLSDLVVSYTVKGGAVNGQDYVLLKGTAKVKAGKTTKAIKVTPVGTLGGAAKRVVKLTLAAGANYTVGTPGPLKVKIVAGP